MSKIKSFFLSHWQKIGYLLLSLCLPMLCVLAILGFRGVLLRGDASLFTSAFAEGILSRIAEAKEMGGDLLSLGGFTFNGDVFVLLAGLLPASPLNSAIIAIMLCAGLTALSFYLACRGFGIKEIPSLAASVLYGLNGYAFVAFLVEGASSLLLILPLLLLAEHWLIQKGRMWPFALFLSLAFLLDIRSLWICFIAVLAWFFYDVFGLSQKGEREKVWTTLVRLGITFLMAVAIGLSTCIEGFKNLVFSPEITMDANFDFLSFFAKMLPGIYDGVRPDSLPYVCFGLLPILVLPLYFTSNAIEKREKVASGILLGGLFLSMVARAIGCAVDLFGQGALPVYAQTAIFGFVALFLSAKALSLEKSDNHSPLFMAYGFLSFLLVIVQKMSLTYQTKDNKITAEYATDTENIWITLFLATILVFVLHAFLKRNKKRVACFLAIGLLATVSLEATFGQLKLLKSFQTEYPYYSRQELSRYYDAYRQSMKALEAEMDEGYRAEKVHSLFAGENAFLGFDGVDAVGVDGSTALALLGGKVTSGGVMYQSGIPALDALLSVKYLAEYRPETEETDADEDKTPAEKSTFEKIKEALFPEDDFVRDFNLPNGSVSQLYRLLLEEDLYTLWENPYALALLSSYSESLKDIDFTFPTEADLLKNDRGEYVFPDDYSADGLLYSPVDRLNAVWSALSGKNVTLFKKLTDVQGNALFVSPHNCQESQDNLGHAVYTVNTGKNDPYVKFTMTVTQDAEVLMYLPAIIGREAEVWVNGKCMAVIHQDNQAQNGLLSLGKMTKGSIMQVEIHFETEKGYTDFYLLKDANAGSDWASSLFYVADNDAFLDMMSQSTFGTFEVEKLTDNVLTGTLTPDAGQTAVFTSLAYSEGIAVKVDGKRVDTYAVAGGLLGFDLPDDSAHTIRIEQKGEPVSPLYTAMTVLGSVSVLLLALYEFVGKEKCLLLWQKVFPKKHDAQ